MTFDTLATRIIPQSITVDAFTDAMAELSRRKPRSKDGGDVYVGSYKLVEEIGKGSFALVYLGEHPVSVYPMLMLATWTDSDRWGLELRCS